MFIDIRRQLTEFRGQTGAVVEAYDVVGHIERGFGMVGIIVRPEARHLQIQEKALDGSVPAVVLCGSRLERGNSVFR